MGFHEHLYPPLTGAVKYREAVWTTKLTAYQQITDILTPQPRCSYILTPAHVVKRTEHFSHRERLESWDCSAWPRKSSGGYLKCLHSLFSLFLFFLHFSSLYFTLSSLFFSIYPRKILTVLLPPLPSASSSLSLFYLYCLLFGSFSNVLRYSNSVISSQLNENMLENMRE